MKLIAVVYSEPLDDDLCGERERWMGSNSNIHISLALIHISYNTNTHRARSHYNMICSASHAAAAFDIKAARHQQLYSA
jgi:hypothetical protein